MSPIGRLLLNDISPLLTYYFSKYKVLEQEIHESISVDMSDGAIIAEILEARISSLYLLSDLYRWFDLPTIWMFQAPYLNNFSLAIFWQEYKKNNKGTFLICKILEDARKISKIID